MKSLATQAVKALTSEHQKRVFLLYRKSLRGLMDHFPFRDDYNDEARKIREEFEEHKNEMNPSKIEFLLQRGEYWLELVRTTAPYIHPTHKGGTSYLRNEPMPDKLVKNHSIDDGHHKH